MKVVYLWKNGQAIIVHKTKKMNMFILMKNGQRTNLLKVSSYLAIMSKQWVGQTQDELEKMLPEVEIPVDDKDIAIAKLTSLVVDLQEEVMSLKQNIALITEEQANQKLGKHNMDKVVIDLYKKNYTLTKLSKSLLELVGLLRSNSKKLQVKITNRKLNSLWFYYK